jgi:hypothetical protein
MALAALCSWETRTTMDSTATIMPEGLADDLGTMIASPMARDA